MKVKCSSLRQGQAICQAMVRLRCNPRMHMSNHTGGDRIISVDESCKAEGQQCSRFVQKLCKAALKHNILCLRHNSTSHIESLLVFLINKHTPFCSFPWNIRNTAQLAAPQLAAKRLWFIAAPSWSSHHTSGTYICKLGCKPSQLGHIPEEE